MRYGLWLLLATVSVGCNHPAVFTVQDRTGLAAHLSYNIVVNQNHIPDNKPDLKPGSPCPECGGRGKQGDGTIEFPCKACNGTGKVQPKTSNILTRQINQATVQLNWPPRELPDFNVTPTSQILQSNQLLLKPIRKSNTRWSVGGKKVYTIEELIEHLKIDHKFDGAGYDRAELETIHDNLHNGYTALGSK